MENRATSPPCSLWRRKEITASTFNPPQEPDRNFCCVAPLPATCPPNIACGEPQTLPPEREEEKSLRGYVKEDEEMKGNKSQPWPGPQPPSWHYSGHPQEGCFGRRVGAEPCVSRAQQFLHIHPPPALSCPVILNLQVTPGEEWSKGEDCSLAVKRVRTPQPACERQ